MISVLSENQKRLLRAIASEKLLTGAFYFGGGTALAEHYLQHRYSEDLDFFCESEFDPISIAALLKKIQRKAGATRMRYEQSFNRNLFFVALGGEEVKTEFTYYPFSRIETGKAVGGLQIDSLRDIAVNKIFTIYQRPRSRDFIDLYCIFQKTSWPFSELARMAQIKFDTYLDPIMMGAQLLRVTELKDYPRMIRDVSHDACVDYFIGVARGFEGQVFE
jgi:predicted nucleotidyltransferase component of viral defense system